MLLGKQLTADGSRMQRVLNANVRRMDVISWILGANQS